MVLETVTRTLRFWAGLYLRFHIQLRYLCSLSFSRIRGSTHADYNYVYFAVNMLSYMSQYNTVHVMYIFGRSRLWWTFVPSELPGTTA